MTSTRNIAAILSAAAFFASSATVMAAEPGEPAQPAMGSPAAATEGTASPEPAAASPVATPAPATPKAEPTREVLPPTTTTQDALTAPRVAEPAQPEAVPTLLGAKAAVGGYGGLGVMYTRFAGKDSAQVCLEGAVILDHALSLGLAGCGVSRTVRTTKLDPTADPNYRTGFGYGGALVRYQLASHRFFNVSLGALVGAGAIASSEWDEEDGHFDSEDDHPDMVFVAEPQLAANINMTRWLRLSAVGGYRFVSGVDTKGLSNSDVAAPTVGVQVQAGWL